LELHICIHIACFCRLTRDDSRSVHEWIKNNLCERMELNESTRHTTAERDLNWDARLQWFEFCNRTKAIACNRQLNRWNDAAFHWLESCCTAYGAGHVRIEPQTHETASQTSTSGSCVLDCARVRRRVCSLDVCHNTVYVAYTYGAYIRNPPAFCRRTRLRATQQRYKLNCGVA